MPAWHSTPIPNSSHLHTRSSNTTGKETSTTVLTTRPPPRHTIVRSEKIRGAAVDNDVSPLLGPLSQTSKSDPVTKVKAKVKVEVGVNTAADERVARKTSLGANNATGEGAAKSTTTRCGWCDRRGCGGWWRARRWRARWWRARWWRARWWSPIGKNWLRTREYIRCIRLHRVNWATRISQARITSRIGTRKGNFFCTRIGVTSTRDGELWARGIVFEGISEIYDFMA